MWFPRKGQDSHSSQEFGNVPQEDIQSTHAHNNNGDVFETYLTNQMQSLNSAMGGALDAYQGQSHGQTAFPTLVKQEFDVGMEQYIYPPNPAFNEQFLNQKSNFSGIKRKRGRPKGTTKTNKKPIITTISRSEEMEQYLYPPNPFLNEQLLNQKSNLSEIKRNREQPIVVTKPIRKSKRTRISKNKPLIGKKEYVRKSKMKKGFLNRFQLVDGLKANARKLKRELLAGQASSEENDHRTDTTCSQTEDVKGEKQGLFKIVLVRKLNTVIELT